MPLNSNQIYAKNAFEAIMQRAASLRSSLQVQRGILSQDGGSADVVLNAMRGVKVTRDNMQANVGAAGLNAYVRVLYDDPARDFVADVNAAIAACNTLLSWVAANFPKDQNGYLLKDQIVNGEIVSRTFTAAQMAELVDEIDALIAAL